MVALDKKNTPICDYRGWFYFKIHYSLDSKGEYLHLWIGRVTQWLLTIGLAGCLVSSTMSDNIEQSLANVKDILLILMVWLAGWNEYFNRDKLKRLMNFLKERGSKIKYDSPKELEIVKDASLNATRDLKAIVIMFIICFYMITFGPAVGGWFNGGSWMQLPFPWVYPKDNITIFTTLFILQLIIIILSHCAAVTGMSFTCIATQLSAQFDVVVYGIKTIETRASKKPDQLLYSKRMITCLKESIAHHQEIVRELVAVKHHLQSTFFCQIMTISFIMACEVYPLTVNDLTIADATHRIIFLGVQVLCTAVVCDRMETLSNKNTEVFDALYQTPWYKCDPSYRKILLNGLTFCRTPIPIRGRFLLGLVATRQTFYSALSTSYNSLNLFRNMT